MAARNQKREEDDEEEPSIKDPDVRTKTKQAAQFANQVLAAVLKECKPGKSVLELCTLGDSMIVELTAPVYSKAKGEDKVERGIAFPTCVSVNNVVCHFSPLPDDKTILKDGDLVRVDLGVHIDGYAAVAAHTIVVQEEPKPITGKLADLMVAAQQCIDVAIHSLRPGCKNSDIPPLWAKTAEAYGVQLCEAILSHQMKRFVIDGNEVILSKPSVEQRVEEYDFDNFEVWAIDVVLSSGPGKLREQEARTFVYKRNPDRQYLLKLKASKEALREINQRFQNFPFSVRALDAKSGRMGVAECVKHELLAPYPVLYEKPGELCVHFKCTVWITASAIEMIAGFPLQQQCESEIKLSDSGILEVLSRDLDLRDKKSKAKAKAKAKPKPKATAATTPEDTQPAESATSSTSASSSEPTTTATGSGEPATGSSQADTTSPP